MRRLRRENTAPRRNDSTTALRLLALFNPLHFARISRKLATDSVHLLRQLMRSGFKKRRAQQLFANKNRHIRCLLSPSQSMTFFYCVFFMFSCYVVSFKHVEMYIFFYIVIPHHLVLCGIHLLCVCVCVLKFFQICITCIYSYFAFAQCPNEKISSKMSRKQQSSHC